MDLIKFSALVSCRGSASINGMTVLCLFLFVSLSVCLSLFSLSLSLSLSFSLSLFLSLSLSLFPLSLQDCYPLVQKTTMVIMDRLLRVLQIDVRMDWRLLTIKMKQPLVQPYFCLMPGNSKAK